MLQIFNKTDLKAQKSLQPFAAIPFPASVRCVLTSSANSPLGLRMRLTAKPKPSIGRGLKERNVPVALYVNHHSVFSVWLSIKK